MSSARRSELCAKDAPRTIRTCFITREAKPSTSFSSAAEDWITFTLDKSSADRDLAFSSETVTILEKAAPSCTERSIICRAKGMRRAIQREVSPESACIIAAMVMSDVIPTKALSRV